MKAVLNRKMSKKTTRKYADRQKSGEVEKPLLDQFQTGKLIDIQMMNYDIGVVQIFEGPMIMSWC